jgi:hypothetical protein
MGVKLVEDVKFQEWFERKLNEKFNAKSHEELKRKLEAAYDDNPYELKLLFQMLLAEYHKTMSSYGLSTPRKKRKAIEITGVV